MVLRLSFLSLLFFRSFRLPGGCFLLCLVFMFFVDVFEFLMFLFLVFFRYVGSLFMASAVFYTYDKGADTSGMQKGK